MGKKGGFCPSHGDDLIPIIVRKEDAQDKAIRTENTAKRVAQAGKKVGESAGKPTDPFGLGDVFRGMADKIDRGERLGDDDNYDDEDEDDEDEDEDRPEQWWDGN